MEHQIKENIREQSFHLKVATQQCPKAHTFTLAENVGKVDRISISKAGGGTNRSPFLTAPFTNIVRAFGADNILTSKHYHQESDLCVKKK